MKTRFNVGDEVLIKAKVHSIKIHNDNDGILIETYFLDIPGSSLNNLLQLNESHITDKHEIIDGYVNESIIEKIENSELTYPKELNCRCDMNPKGGM